MSDTKNNANKSEDTPVEVLPTDVRVTANPNNPTQLEEQVSRPDLQMLDGKEVPEGYNLYFFPDIQKSVVAKSLEDATKEVQSELSANKEENK